MNILLKKEIFVIKYYYTYLKIVFSMSLNHIVCGELFFVTTRFIYHVWNDWIKKKKKKKEVYRNKPSTRTIFTIISFRYFLNNDIHKNDKSFEQSNIFLFNNIINIYAILMHNKTIYITESHYKNSYCRE